MSAVSQGRRLQALTFVLEATVLHLSQVLSRTQSAYPGLGLRNNYVVVCGGGGGGDGGSVVTAAA